LSLAIGCGALSMIEASVWAAVSRWNAIFPVAIS
jgi:hypothetical protein